MNRLRRIAALVVVAALSFAACDSDTEPPTSADPSSEPPATTSSEPTAEETLDPEECEDNEVAMSDDEAFLPGSLVADFDGDGGEDGARISIFEEAEPGCEAMLVIEGDDSLYSTPVWRFGADAGLEQPGLYAMVEINGVPGLEILVNEAQGASSQFIGAYAVVEGELRMITLPGGGEFGGLFAYGGSVGHLEAVDCTGPGRIVVTLATPAEGRKAQRNAVYEMRRRFYRVEGAELVPDGEEQKRGPFDIGVLPEFGIGPFASCA